GSTLTFAGGAGETQSFTVQVNGDLTVEADEMFNVALGALGNLAAGVDAADITTVAGTGTITNDDTATLTVGGVTASETDSGPTDFVFVVTLNQAVQGGFQIPIDTSDDTATVGDSDYAANTGSTLTFAGGAGETQNFTVQVSGDLTVEADELFNVALGVLSNLDAGVDSADITRVDGTGSITNDDTTTLTVGSVSQSEGDSGPTDFVFVVTLNQAVQGGFEVPIDTSDDTATVGDSDYAANTGSTLTFVGGAGETQNFTVQVSGDTTSEADELFDVALGALSDLGAGIDAADITTLDGTGTILNDDGATLSIDDVSGAEESGELVFTVTLTGGSDAFTVDFATADITGQAVAGADYASTSGSGGTALSFTGVDGESMTIAVPLTSDLVVEADETFELNLSNVQGGGRVPTIADGQGIGTITNDDTPTIVFVDDDWTGLPLNADPDGTGAALGDAVAIGVDAFVTLQEAIDAVVDDGTGEVRIYDGLYVASNTTIDKPVLLQGQSESGVVIAPAGEDDNLDSVSAGVTHNGLIVQSSDVRISTLTIDGEANVALTPGKSNFRTGIVTRFDTGTVYDNLDIRDVTILRVFRRGIQLYSGATSGPITARSTGNVIDGVTIDDVSVNFAIVVFESDAQITNNVIRNAAAGIGSNYLQGPVNAPLLTIRGNDIANVVEAINASGLAGGSRIGGPGAGDANLIDLTQSSGTSFDGGIVLQYAEGVVTVEGNTILASEGDTGMLLFQNRTLDRRVVVSDNVLSAAASDGTVRGEGTGIFVTDEGDFFGDSDGPGYATIAGNSITGFARGIDVHGASTGAAGVLTLNVTLDGNEISGGEVGLRVFEADGSLDNGGDSGALPDGYAVEVSVLDDLSGVTGTGTALEIENAQFETPALATLTGHSIGIRLSGSDGRLSMTGATVTGNGVGVAVSGGVASIDGNDLTANTTGVRIDPGGSASILNNDLSGGTTGVRVDGGRALIENNDLTGNTTGLRVEGDGLVDAGDVSDEDVTGLGTGGASGGSSAGLNDLTGYDGTTTFAIVNDNLDASGNVDVLAQGNRFGFVLPSAIESVVVHTVDDPVRTEVLFTPAIAPEVTLAVQGVAAVEGDAGPTAFVFFVSVDLEVPGGFGLPIGTADGTATVADGDYAAPIGGTLTFAGTAGEMQPFTVTVNGDEKVEADEVIDVVLGVPTGLDPEIDAGSFVRLEGTVTILNDDTATLSIGGVSLSEGDIGPTAFVFEIALDQAVQGGFGVAIDTADGSATVADGDYGAQAGGAVTFAGSAGETQSFTVTVNGDEKVESDESFTIALGTVTDLVDGVSATSILRVDGSATILNDDTQKDFGDAPAPYPTLLDENGPRHEGVGPVLGLGRDIEDDGQAAPGADGDDDMGGPNDEDGVVFTGSVFAGQVNAQVTIQVSETAVLDGWFDFDADGTWSGAGERIFSGVSVDAGLNVLSFSVPADARQGVTFARVRLTRDGVSAPTGRAPDGEVEDHAVTVVAPLGAGDFVPGPNELGSHFSEKVAVGDLDGDGDVDAFVVHRNQANRVWINDGAGGFTDSNQLLGNHFSLGVALGDVDGDGDLDAFTANFFQGNRVWINDGSGGFNDSGQSLGLHISVGVALGDVDGDGDLDAFVANRNQGNRVWFNDGAGVFSDSAQELGFFTSETVALGDLDRDGDLDAFVGNRVQGGRIWLNDGAGQFSENGQIQGAAESAAVALGDLDGDGDLDAVVANDDQPNRVWINRGDALFDVSEQLLGSGESRSLGLADLDSDGDLDAFVANRVGGNKVWLNDGTGAFADAGQALGDHRALGAALGDLDGDGDVDAFVVSGFNEPDHTWLNQGPTIEFDAATVQVDETDAVIELTLVNTGGSSSDAEVLLSITGGSATGGDDYDDAAFPLSVVFSSQQLTRTITIPLNDDQDAEGLEDLTLEVTAVRNATIGAQRTTTVQILDDDAAPTVTDVFVSSTFWSQSFMDEIAATGQGEAVGYRVPMGSAAQLAAMPWSTLNQVSVRFGAPVVVSPVDVLVTGVNRPAYNGPLIYDPATFTLTMTLVEAIASDRITLTVRDSVVDLNGTALDGEWSDGVSAVSGDGTAGGDFVFNLNTLVGDADGDGTVSVVDVSTYRNAFGTNTASPTFEIRADIDGDAIVDSDDTDVLRARLGRALPAGQPPLTLPSPPAAGAFDPVTVTGNRVIMVSPTQVVNGSLDLTVESGDGSPVDLVNYSVRVRLSGPSAGQNVTLTGGGEAGTNPAAAAPVLNEPGDGSLLPDEYYLSTVNLVPNPVLITPDGGGLMRVDFQVQPSVLGVYTVQIISGSTLDTALIGDFTDATVAFTTVDPTITVTIPGDLNGDFTVGADDLSIVLANFTRNVPVGDFLQGDSTGPGGLPDGVVGAADLNIVLANFTNSVVPPTARYDDLFGAMSSAASSSRGATPAERETAGTPGFGDYLARFRSVLDAARRSEDGVSRPSWIDELLDARKRRADDRIEDRVL
ncbi:MAG: hypothetical protein CMJ18_17100, partial [Phycisphaeraceae bacterium]|nr:hypothetical protein [Phycisphaeraceae bacterium]